MKTKKLMGLATLFLAMGMIGCNKEPEIKWEKDKTYHWQLNEDGTVNKDTKVKHEYEEEVDKAVAPTCSQKGKKFEVCKICGYENETDVKTLDHEMVDDPSAKVNATCTTDGKTVKKCKNCDYKEETVIPAAHTISYTNFEASGDAIKGKTGECSVCHEKQIVLAATDGIMASGSSNKSGIPDGFIKLNSNGNSISFPFNSTVAKQAKLAFECVMDAWTDESGSNKTRTFYTSKSADYTEVDTPNLGVEVNDTAVDTSALKGIQYSEIFTTVDNPVASNYSGVIMLNIGNFDMVNGLNTIKLTRNESFNVIIKNIYVIY